MPSDPFTTLALPRSFDLSDQAIESAFVRRSVQVQPSGDEHALEELNRARDLLIDPEHRAAELLALVAPPEVLGDRSLPPEFLQTIMDIRVRIEDELATDPQARARWRAWGQARRGDHVRRVSELFAVAGDPPARDLLVLIKRELNAWRYIERLLEQLSLEAGNAGDHRWT